MNPLEVRVLFPRLHDVIFMNHAAVSRLSTQTRAAIVRAAEELAGPIIQTCAGELIRRGQGWQRSFMRRARGLL